MLEEFAASGESAARFARRSGVSARRLAYWKERLADTGKPAFVPVALPSASAAAACAHLEIVSGGVMVRVREDLDVEHLARIVEALARRNAGC